MINIDYTDKRPIYEQVTDRMKDLIVKGVLSPEEKLPSVRALAMETSINPNTIQRAYASLESSGFIYTVRGRGNFVSDRSRWIGDVRADALAELKGALKSARALGISRDEAIGAIEEEYGHD